MGLKRKCENRLCDNLSRSFENKYCSILCADTHDGIISEIEWCLINPYASWIRTNDNARFREKHLQDVYKLLKEFGYH